MSILRSAGGRDAAVGAWPAYDARTAVPTAQEPSVSTDEHDEALDHGSGRPIAGGRYEGWSRHADRVVSPTGSTVFLTGDDAACCGCGTDTHAGHEQFMLTPQVWAEATERAAMEPQNAGGHVVLCVGCVESALGRPLQPDDFDWSLPLNRMATYSPRLLDRMGTGSAEGSAS